LHRVYSLGGENKVFINNFAALYKTEIKNCRLYKKTKTLLKQRYKILFNYVLGPILFIILSWSIYTKIQRQPNLEHSWQLIQQSTLHNGKGLITALILLMLVNWSFEARKWQILINPIQRITFFKAFRAVLSGLSFSLFIPNGVGEYIGRLLYMSEGNRLRSIAVTLVGSMAQLIVTLVAGTIGLIYLRVHAFSAITQVGLSVFWLNGLMYALVVAITLLLLIYFKLSWFTQWFEKIPFVYKHRIFVQSLEDFHWRELTRILALSVCRFVVFIVQYILVLKLFNVNISYTDSAWATSVLFLVLAIVPTLPIADVGIRGEVCVQLFGLFSTNTVGIAFTAATVWLVNIIIPALAGSLFILTVKFFRNK